MKRLVAFLLCIIFLLCGCSSGVPVAEADLPEEVGIQTEIQAIQTQTLDDDLICLRQWLGEKYSYSISKQYMNLAINGFSQVITQETAQDGSFHFVVNWRQWDHPTNYDNSSKREYYYRYEGFTLCCYLRENDGEPTRMKLNKSDMDSLTCDKAQVIGPDALLPDYLEDFREIYDEEAGQSGFSFRLPLKDVLSDDTLLRTYIDCIFCLLDSAYDPALNLNICCVVWTDPDTLQPIKLFYDFSELKPYVLTNGALSGEYALNTELMYFIYEFNYETIDTIPVPQDFIP